MHIGDNGSSSYICSRKQHIYWNYIYNMSIDPFMSFFFSHLNSILFFFQRLTGLGDSIILSFLIVYRDTPFNHRIFFGDDRVKFCSHLLYLICITCHTWKVNKIYFY